MLQKYLKTSSDNIVYSFITQFTKMKFKSSKALLDTCIENNTSRKRSTVVTYARETMRVLRNCYGQEKSFDMAALYDTDRYKVWVRENISVKRIDNITNSIYQVIKLVGYDELKSNYKILLTEIRKQYKNEKAMALTKRTKKQKDSWIPYKTLQKNRDEFFEAFDKKQFPKNRGRNAFTNAMIWACFVNDKFVLRPSELRTMKIIDDGVSNYFDVTNKIMTIRQHKNDKLSGIRVVQDVPDIIVKYVKLFHERYPNLKVMIPTTTGKVPFSAKFTAKVQKVIGVQPSIVRTIFVSDVCSKMDDTQRILAANNMGHTFMTSRMIYQKDD